MVAKPPRTEAQLYSKLTKTAKKGLDKSKAIKPPNTSAAAIEKAYQDATKAIESITRRKDELAYYDDFGKVAGGRVPKNLTEFSQAIQQLREAIYNKYNLMQKKAGETGVMVRLDSIIPELETIINDPGIRTHKPKVAEFAQKQLEAIQKQGAYTPEVAQTTIARMNKELKAYDKNPNPQLTGNMEVTSLIRNHLRKNLDDSIMQATGEAYAPLKAEYGALKSIEQGVNTRMLRDNQTAGASSLNFYEVLSAHNLLSGKFFSGGGMALISAGRRWAKNPNTHIKKMFKDADKIVTKMKKLMPEKEAAETVTAVMGAMQQQQQLQLPAGRPKPMLEAPGPKIGKRNQLAPPQPPGPGIQALQNQGSGPTINMSGPRANLRPSMEQFRKPNSWERMYEIAQSPIGKQLLVERLGREARHSELLKSIMEVKLLESPGVYRVKNPLGKPPTRGEL